MVAKTVVTVGSVQNIFILFYIHIRSNKFSWWQIKIIRFSLSVFCLFLFYFLLDPALFYLFI